MNKFLLVAIGLLLLLGLTGYFTSFSTSLNMFPESFIAAAEYLAILMMLLNGTFMRTRLFYIAVFLMGLIVLGLLFKIMHLPGAHELLLYPFIGLFCVYAVHFARKTTKHRTDFLKVLMLTGFLILPPLLVSDVVPEAYEEVLLHVSRVLFWFTFLDFLNVLWRRRSASGQA